MYLFVMFLSIRTNMLRKTFQNTILKKVFKRDFQK